MKWINRRHIFKPSGEFGWMNSHAQIPTVLDLGDKLAPFDYEGPFAQRRLIVKDFGPVVRTSDLPSEFFHIPRTRTPPLILEHGVDENSRGNHHDKHEISGDLPPSTETWHLDSQS